MSRWFLCVASLLLPSIASAQPPTALSQHLGHLAPSTLETSTGGQFDPAPLRGKAWVAHFFYTTCTGGCTKTAPTMMALQKAFAGKRDVALVSISLNEDSPETLRRYASDLGADAEQWLFLTGPREDVHKIV